MPPESQTTDINQSDRKTADQAIVSEKQDVLGRSPFAKHLAKFIADWSGEYSLVIALHGSWGSGKSSIKNLTVEALKAIEGRKNTTIHFNPWRWSGQDQITTAFFHEVGIALGESDIGGSNSKVLEDKWIQIGTRLSLGSSLASAGKLVGLAIAGWDGGLTSLVAAEVERALKAASAQADQASKTFAAKAEHVPTLEKLKEDLARELAKLPEPILIVMDDIDRLSPDELKQFFGLVKANADFPNLVFLLLFQRDSVAASLEKSLNIPSGDQYLKKIIQLEFDIPQIDQTQLDEILFQGIREAFPNTPHDFLENIRWIRLYGRALQDYFQTLRDVYRFTTTLSFHVSLLSKGGILEVNPIDLVTLQALRVFEPVVYQLIAKSKQVLTVNDATIENLNEQDEDPNARTKYYDRVKAIYASPTEPFRQERLWEILSVLFPAATGLPEEARYGFPYENEWERARFVCHPNIFDIYFYLGTPRGQVSRAQIHELITSARSHDEFSGKLMAFYESGMLMPALRGIASYLEQIDLSYAVPFLTALFDLSDTFENVREEPNDTHVLTLLRVIATSLLDRIENSQMRFTIIEEALKITTGTLLPFRVVRYESKAENLEIAQLNVLQGLAANKITAFVRVKQLSAEVVVQSYINDWLKWGRAMQPTGEIAAETWIREQLTDKTRFRIFLRVFKTNRRKEYFDSSDISLQFILSEIAQRAENLNFLDISQEEKEGALRLIQEYKDIEAYIDHMEQPPREYEEEEFEN